MVVPNLVLLSQNVQLFRNQFLLKPGNTTSSYSICVRV